ncbi:MAG: phosphoribosylanthranilate isomerase [Clostridiales bacterium]|jgi:phosphoribosylanthranilate isomerase|nr:phosphoribosylanthranilate isomerase [Clostridiales bacterium]
MIKCKVCGLFRDVDIDSVNQAKPDYAGFVFAGGRRGVTHEFAQRARQRLGKEIETVGVFVNAPFEEIEELVKSGTISVVQLHGGESEEQVIKVKGLGVTVIKAVSADGGLPGEIWETQADFLLLDSGKGGTGKKFDWGLIRGRTKPFFLAGGVGPEDVKRAQEIGAYGVDASSSLETNGLKDQEKIKGFVLSCRIS